MKIVHVIDNLGQGGAQRIALGIVNELDLKLVVLNRREKEFNLKNKERVVFLGNGNRLNIQSIWQFYQYVKKNKIDLIHTHLFKGFFAGLFTKLLLGNKVVLVAHDHGQILNPNNFILGFLYRLLLLKSNFFVWKYIVVSDYAKTKIKRFVREKNVLVMNNFIDDKFFENRKCLQRSSNQFIIGFAGRLNKNKGILDFVLAMKIIVDKYPDTKVLIAGDGELRETLSKIVKELKLDKNIELLGLVQDMTSFYKRISIFVNPSYYEAMGLTHIEAMAMGVPVVVSNVPAMNAMLTNRKNCLFFEKGDIDDMVSKIIKLLIDNQLSERLSNEGVRFAGDFTREKYILRLEKIYE